MHHRDNDRFSEMMQVEIRTNPNKCSTGTANEWSVSAVDFSDMLHIIYAKRLLCKVNYVF